MFMGSQTQVILIPDSDARCPASLSGGMAQPLRSGRGPIGPATAPKPLRGPRAGRHADGSCPEGSRCLSWDPGRLLDSGTEEGCGPGPVFLPTLTTRSGDGVDPGAGGRQSPPSPLSFHCPPGTYTSTNICQTPTRFKALTCHQGGCSCQGDTAAPGARSQQAVRQQEPGVSRFLDHLLPRPAASCAAGQPAGSIRSWSSGFGSVSGGSQEEPGGREDGAAGAFCSRACVPPSEAVALSWGRLLSPQLLLRAPLTVFSLCPPGLGWSRLP